MRYLYLSDTCASGNGTWSNIGSRQSWQTWQKLRKVNEKSRLQINFTTLFPNGPACISRGFLCSKQGQHYERYMWRRGYIMSWILWRDRDIIRGGYLKFSKTSSSKEPELSYQALFGTHIKGIVMKGREGSYKMRILWKGEVYDIKWGYYERGKRYHAEAVG